MDEVRTELELLQIVRAFLTKGLINEVKGLCTVCSRLYYNNIITNDEALMLHRIITRNIKSYPNIHTHYADSYFWKPGLLKPRIRYVNWLIEQRSNRESMKSTIWKRVITKIRRLTKSLKII